MMQSVIKHRLSNAHPHHHARLLTAGTPPSACTERSLLHRNTRFVATYPMSGKGTVAAATGTGYQGIHTDHTTKAQRLRQSSPRCAAPQTKVGRDIITIAFCGAAGRTGVAETDCAAIP
jgi:hypothetical protein